MTTPSRTWLILGIDALLLALSFVLAYSLRFEFAIPADYNTWDYATQMKMLLPWVVGTHLGLFWLLKLYRGLMRYVGLSELRAIGIAGAAHLAVWLAIDLAIDRQPGLLGLPLSPDDNTVMRVPLSVLLYYAVLAVVAVGAFRLTPRLWAERVRTRSATNLPRTLIVGAGDTGASLIAAVRREPEPSLNIICIVTIYQERVGRIIADIPVVAMVEKLGEVIARERIDLVLIALDEQTPARLREVVKACETARVGFRIVPSITNIVGGEVEIGRMRPIEVEDLLGRPPHELPFLPEKSALRGERVLVTGAGGSIGSELCRQVAACAPAKLVLLGKGENSLFDIATELRAAHPQLALETVVGDIRDAGGMRRLFEAQHPAFVFHAAAHKHVPLMERQPAEAVRNNVLGTATLAHLADKFGCRAFVLISTDKAVRPTSVMGATKRLAEMCVFSIGRGSRTVFHAVRFGNVLGSRGSVIPLFRRQIEAGGPVTVTHPDVTRYFMTIPEAVSLVLQAGSFPGPGSLFLLDMGEPIRIADLARNMIAIARPDAGIKVEYVGLRPGEKLHEELLTAEEGASKTEIGKLFSTAPKAVPEWRSLRPGLEELDALADAGDAAAVVRKLAELVPDYSADEWLRTAPAPPAAPPAGECDTPATGSDLPSPAGATPAAPPAPEPEPVEPAPAAADPPEDLLAAAAEQEDLFGAPVEPAQEAPPDTAELDEGAPPQEPLAGARAHVVDARTESPTEELPPPDIAAYSDTEPIPGAETGDRMTDEFPMMAQEPESPEGPRRPKCVWIFYSGGAVPIELTIAIDYLRTQLGPDDAVIVAGAGLPTIPLAECAEWLDSRGLGPAGIWHEVLDRFPDAEAGAIIPPNVRFAGGSLEKLVGALDGRGDAVAVYCDYMHVKGSDEASGSVRQVTLLDHENCLHERFDFGPMLLYDLRAVRRVGGFHRELKHAWEYDMHLRLAEIGRFLRVPTPLYTYFTGNGTSSTGTALFSPGLGPLGGFSYVFYPPELEAEITGVFEDALRRRHAFLDLPVRAVPYPAEREPVACSVVIPVLNRERFIGNAIRKVLSGTFGDFEVIVVDNGSTDGTRGVVEGIAAEDARVRLVHGTGGTIASALNEGIRAARGRYICQLDSDDEYAPATLERMVAAFEADPTCGLAISYYRLMDEAGVPIEDVEPVTHAGYSRNQILRREGAGALRVFPKCVLEEFGLYDEVNCANFGEDYDMVLKVSEHYNVVRVPEVLYFYRRHEGNTDVTRDAGMKYRNKNGARQAAMQRRRSMVLAARDAAKRNILPVLVPQDA